VIWSFPNLAVAPGWHYGIYLRAQCPAGQNPLFPSGVELFAQVRQQADWPVLAELSTETGGIMRISDAELVISIAANLTAAFKRGYVYADIVRSGWVPGYFPGLRLMIPVEAPITVLAA